MKWSGIQKTVCFIIPYQNSSCLLEGQTVLEGRFSENLVIKLKITCTNSNIICCISCTKHSSVSFCFALYLKGIFLLSNNLFSFSHLSFFTFVLLFYFSAFLHNIFFCFVLNVDGNPKGQNSLPLSTLLSPKQSFFAVCWGLPPPHSNISTDNDKKHTQQFSRNNLSLKFHAQVLTIVDISGIRASGLIPVIPLTVINKDTQLPMCIEEQAINY